ICFMRGRWAIAVLIVLLVPVSRAQMRGASRGSVSVGRPGFTARGPAVASRGQVLVGSVNRGVRFRSEFGTPFFFHRAFHTSLLMFLYRHMQEVENDAIVRQTLWICSEQRASKVTLSCLDIDATAKANDERVLGLRVPQ